MPGEDSGGDGYDAAPREDDSLVAIPEFDTDAPVFAGTVWEGKQLDGRTLFEKTVNEESGRIQTALSSAQAACVEHLNEAGKHLDMSAVELTSYLLNGWGNDEAEITREIANCGIDVHVGAEIGPERYADAGEDYTLLESLAQPAHGPVAERFF